MFARIRPTLASLIPWRKASDRVTELKPWVRFAVTAYVLTVVPLLLFLFSMMIINAPRIIGTAYDSFFVQYHKVQHAFDGGSALNGTIGVLQMLILILPAIGIVATFWLVSKRSARFVWSHTEAPAARGAFVVGVGAVGALLAYLWWPNGEYRPIQRGEKGTIQGALQQFSQVSSGRPALTKGRERQLGGAPLQSSQNESKTGPPTESTPTPTDSTPTSTSPTPTDTETATTTTSTTTDTTTNPVTTTTSTP
jgi:hypothetical protein